MSFAFSSNFFLKVYFDISIATVVSFGYFLCNVSFPPVYFKPCVFQSKVSLVDLV